MSKIIIVGAGISGLVTGILLKQQGFQVEIYEKRKQIAPIGGGLGIWPNGSQTLLKLPCAEKILAIAGKPIFSFIGDAEGNTLATNSEDCLLQINGNPMLYVCRSELHKILFDEFGPENVRFDAECNSIEEQENKVFVHFDNQPSAEADLVIGADGVHSTIRKILFPEVKLEYAGYIQLVGILQLRDPELLKHHFIWGKNNYCIIFPIAGNRYIYYQVRSFEQGRLQQQIKSREQQINLFRGWSNEVDHLLHEFETCLTKPEYSPHYYCGEAHLMPSLPSWHKKQIVLMGDAAHPIGSLLALGASSALEDCNALVNALAQCENYKTAIALYEAQQMPRAVSFLQAEQELTNILIRANEERYERFINEIKFPEAEKSSFLNLLKYSDRMILNKNNCYETII